tara:strand:- start:490 stop:687 length:198 start_codon:yes stop_codon:yes gene_type:complete
MSCEQHDEDKHIVEYDVTDIGNVLSEIRGIENAMDNLKNQFHLIDSAIKNSRKVLHQLDRDKDLP